MKYRPSSPGRHPTSGTASATTLLNEILTAIDKGLEDGQRYSAAAAAKDLAAWRVVIEYAPDKTEKQAREIIKTWLKTGLLVDEEYPNPVTRKSAKGLKVIATKRPGRAVMTCAISLFPIAHQSRKRSARLMEDALRVKPFAHGAPNGFYPFGRHSYKGAAVVRSRLTLTRPLPSRPTFAWKWQAFRRTIPPVVRARAREERAGHGSSPRTR